MNLQRRVTAGGKAGVAVKGVLVPSSAAGVFLFGSRPTTLFFCHTHRALSWGGVHSPPPPTLVAVSAAWRCTGSFIPRRAVTSGSGRPEGIKGPLFTFLNVSLLEAYSEKNRTALAVKSHASGRASASVPLCARVSLRTALTSAVLLHSPVGMTGWFG